jgi:hypothetical protein
MRRERGGGGKVKMQITRNIRDSLLQLLSFVRFNFPHCCTVQ